MGLQKKTKNKNKKMNIDVNLEMKKYLQKIAREERLKQEKEMEANYVEKEEIETLVFAEK